MRLPLISAAALVLLLPAAPAGAATPIGTTAIVTNAVSGKLGPQARNLKRGDPIHQDEEIKTGANSGAQLLFSDETTMTLGADTEVLLDKLVYDPTRKQGEVVIRATTGAFRFISGSSSQESYRVRTPVGTIGVRGTMFSCVVGSAALSCSVQQGAISMCDLAGLCTNVAAGQFAVSTRLGTSPPRPTKDMDCGSGAGSFASGGGRQYCTGFSDLNNPQLNTVLGRRRLDGARVFVIGRGRP
jgi:hypothetical protein